MSRHSTRSSARASRYRRTTTLIASLRDTDNDPTGLPHRDGKTDRQRRRERRESRAAEQEDEMEQEEEVGSDIDMQYDSPVQNYQEGDSKDEDSEHQPHLDGSPGSSGISRSSSRRRARSTGRRVRVRRSNTLIASLRNTDGDMHGLVHRDGTSERDRRHDRRASRGTPTPLEEEAGGGEKSDDEADEENVPVAVGAGGSNEGKRSERSNPYSSAKRPRTKSSGRKSRLRRTNTLIAALRGHKNDGLRALAHRDGTVGSLRSQEGADALDGPRRSKRRSARLSRQRQAEEAVGSGGEGGKQEEDEEPPQGAAAEEEAGVDAEKAASSTKKKEKKKKPAQRKRAIRRKSVGRRRKGVGASASDRKRATPVDCAKLASELVSTASGLVKSAPKLANSLGHHVGGATKAMRLRVSSIAEPAVDYTRKRLGAVAESLWQTLSSQSKSVETGASGGVSAKTRRGEASRSKERNRGTALGAVIALIVLYALSRGSVNRRWGRHLGSSGGAPPPPPPPPPGAAANSTEALEYWKESIRRYEERFASLESRYEATLEQLSIMEEDLQRQAKTCAASVSSGAAGAVDKAVSTSRGEMKAQLSEVTTALRKELDSEVERASKAASASCKAEGDRRQGEMGERLSAAVREAKAAALKNTENAVQGTSASLKKELKTARDSMSDEIKQAVEKSATVQAALRGQEIEAALEKIRKELRREAARHDEKMKHLNEAAKRAAAAGGKASAVAADSNGGAIGLDQLLKREKALTAEIRAKIEEEARSLREELEEVRAQLTSVVSEKIKAANKRHGESIAKLKGSLATLREENSAYFGSGSFAGHKSARNLEAAAKKLKQSHKSRRSASSSNANKKGGGKSGGPVAGPGGGGLGFGGVPFGGHIGASFDRVDEAIKSLSDEQRDSGAELENRILEVRKELEAAFEDRAAKAESSLREEMSRQAKKSPKGGGVSGGADSGAKLRELVESTDKRLSDGIASSKDDLVALSNRLEEASKLHADALDKSLEPLRNSLASLEKKMDSIKEQGSEATREARVSAQKAIDKVAADVDKAVGEAKARSKAAISELEKVRAEVKESLGAAANVGDQGSDIIQANSDLIRAWIKEIVDRQKKELVSRGVKSGTITRELVDSWIEERVLKFAADRTGRVDFAIQSSGARVVHALTSDTYVNPDTSLVRKLARSAGLATHHGPEQVLKPTSNIGR